MNLPLAQKPLTAAAFLEWDATQTERHMFYRGEVFAMAGGTPAHNRIALNLASKLLSHLAGGPCQVFISDVRLELARDEHYTYPDVFVTCDARDREKGENVIRFPNLIIEVLSPPTNKYDRGLKFKGYRDIETVQEVLFIDPDDRLIELFTRSAAPEWTLHPFDATDTVTLDSVKFSFNAADLFVGVVD